MNRWRWLLLIILVCAYPGNAAVGQAKVKPSVKTLATVGMMTRDFVDEGRKNWQGTGPRPLKTTIWYPAQTGSKTETLGDPQQLFVPYTVAPDAEVSRKSPKYSLILVSHGATSEALAMMWLGYYLASQGYIVAAVNHHGNTSAENQLLAQGFFHPWQRPKDLTVMLDKLLADPVFSSRIDKNRIGAAGYSAGGYTVISMAGGIFNLKALLNFCASARRDPIYCDLTPQMSERLAKLEELKKTDPVVQASALRASDSYKDKRIKGVFAIAPAMGPMFTKTELSPIKMPVYLVAGRADVITPLAVDAQWYADLIEGAKLTVLPGEVGHQTFGNECTALGKKTTAWCRDAEGINRTAVHQQVGQLAFEFFEHVWKKSL